MTQTKDTAAARAGNPANVLHSVDKARLHLRDIETDLFDIRAKPDGIAGDWLDRFTASALSAAAALTHTLETLRFSAGFEIFDPKTGQRFTHDTAPQLWARIEAMNDPEALRDISAALLAATIGAPLADFEPEEDSHGHLEVIPAEPEPITGRVVFPPFAGWGGVEEDCRPVFRPDLEGPDVPDINLPRLVPMTDRDGQTGWGVELLTGRYRIDAPALIGFKDGMRIIMPSSLKKPATAHPIT